MTESPKKIFLFIHRLSNPFEYDWQLSGHRFIGERVSVIYPNGLTAIGTVQKYLPPDGDDESKTIQQEF